MSTTTAAVSTTAAGDATTSGEATSAGEATTGDAETTAGDATTGDAETTAGNAALVAVDDTVFARQDVMLVTDAAGGVLTNDVAPDVEPVDIVSWDAMSAAGATVVVAVDGSITYSPPAGFWGPDTFGYAIEDTSGATSSATVTVHVGPIRIPLTEVTAGVGGFVLNSEAVGDRSGASVSGAGDVNGDGMDDLLVGAAFADPNGPASGRSYVVFGKATTTAVELSDIAAGAGGFVLDGEAVDTRSGLSVSGAGDVNGDGMDDLFVGAPHFNPNGVVSDRSYVVFGVRTQGP
ncbi:MAG: FG-GAP repeat protein [Nannocystaceae bacterium]|nr:FG-GAP repeat protein [Nannocystaceae bacterium]